MPRPERIRAREQSRAGAIEERSENISAETDQKPLDDATEAVDVRSGQVSEGELDLSRQVARRLGWVPQDEWRRDPAKWSDAPEFLERTPAEITALKDRLRRSGQVAEDLAEAARREAKAQAETELRAAARSGDEEQVVRAAEKVAKASGPPPQTSAWLARNAWFNADPQAQAVAVVAIRAAEAAGKSIEAQLEAGEAAARDRFPEHFDAPRRERAETRLSDIRTPPPAMAQGSRGGGGRSATKEKGWMDIPSLERNQMQRFVTSATRKGMSAEDAQKRMAASYWSEKA